MEVEYVDYTLVANGSFSLFGYDVLIHHYSVRLLFDYKLMEFIDIESAFQGMKVLFVQDEYDHVDHTIEVINHVGFDLVFTCVPTKSINTIYRVVNTSKTTFVNVLTGYVPLNIPKRRDLMPISQRPISVGYRARSLPLRYGQLGVQKSTIGLNVAKKCAERSISHDISIIESDRIYGIAWDHFLQKCQVTLGSPSGSNVFDFDGRLAAKVWEAKEAGIDEKSWYQSLITPNELPGLMNQISPRIFESIAQGSALMLIEDNYSGILNPGIHYIPIRDDYSNLDEALDTVQDLKAVERVWGIAYEDLIISNRWHYSTLIAQVDAAIMGIDSGSSSATKTSSRINRTRRFRPFGGRATSEPIRATGGKMTFSRLFRIVITPKSYAYQTNKLAKKLRNRRRQI